MAGINAIVPPCSMVRSRTINERRHGSLRQGESWVQDLHLFQIAGLFVVVSEDRDQTAHQDLDGIYDCREAAFRGGREGRRHLGGYVGASIKPDGSLSLGTPYRAISNTFLWIAHGLVLGDRMEEMKVRPRVDDWSGFGLSSLQQRALSELKLAEENFDPAPASSPELVPA